ncbi:uncharacterized protein LAESUDRAFT_238385 [Laetiporus sulphureus 93-53]|uniref:Uncharacterized protein n=1 Tax=Laetiporus sulphureus 93-53 TaxID=1314785 RepID=A0A165DNV6_9APHY|nr:uncharacterized protein LAESUDRAFT_238385 [Laetiporus sulphureus 93-53]KZT05297.1 hypothetical protein LAESUDRAFT_238385 [Laetiporus sulphureus 93-53]
MTRREAICMTSTTRSLCAIFPFHPCLHFDTSLSHRYWQQCPRHPLQGWHHDGCRQPRILRRALSLQKIQCLYSVGSSTVVGKSGGMSDFQYIQHRLDELMVEKFT